MGDGTSSGFDGRLWGPIVLALVLTGVMYLGLGGGELVTRGDRLLLIGRGQAGTPSLALCVGGLLVVAGPFVGAMWSRATTRTATLAGFAGGFATSIAVALVWFRGELLEHDPLVSATWVLTVTIGFAPVAIALGALGGRFGAWIAQPEPVPEEVPAFTPIRVPGESPLHTLLRETRIVQADLEGASRPLSARETTLVFEWVETVRSLPDGDRVRLGDLGIDPTRALTLLADETTGARTGLVHWLGHVEEALTRGAASPAYR